jgi:hypothetical protein
LNESRKRLRPLGSEARAAAAHDGPEPIVRIDTVNDLDPEQLTIVAAAQAVAGISTVVDPCLGAGYNTPRLPLPLKPVDWVVLSVGEDEKSVLIQ